MKKIGLYMIVSGIILIMLGIIIQIIYMPSKWYLYAAVLMLLYLVRDSIKLIKKSN